jgi:hypothetical protein
MSRDSFKTLRCSPDICGIIGYNIRLTILSNCLNALLKSLSGHPILASTVRNLYNGNFEKSRITFDSMIGF